MEVILWKGVPTTSADNTEASVEKNPGMLFIASDDLRKDFTELSSKGVKFIEDTPVYYPFGVRLTAIDPDGNRIALRQRK